MNDPYQTRADPHQTRTRRAKLNGNYPPGCSGTPFDNAPDPHPESERICELLEEHNVPQAVIEDVDAVINKLAVAAEAECPVCVDRYAVSIQAEEVKCNCHSAGVYHLDSCPLSAS